MIDTRSVYTLGQVASVCGCTAKTVRNWCETGLLEHYRVPGGRDRRIHHAALVRFLRANGMLPPAVSASLLLVGVEGPLAGGLAALLAGEGPWRLSVAPGPFGAGLLAATDRFDLAVIDLAVGRVEAWDVASSLRRLEPHRDLPLVCIAPEDGIDTLALASAGFAECLLKPVEPQTLAASVRRLALPPAKPRPERKP